MKSKMRPPGTRRLNLKCDMLLWNFAFKFNLRRYRAAFGTDLFRKPLAVSGRADYYGSVANLAARVMGRGLHSFPFRLKLSSSVHRITQLNS
jgi:hypothetical protein